MKIHLVNYELGRNDGILSKFANKMMYELSQVKGIEVSISNQPDPKADINHHINYLPYRKDPKSKTKNTLMVTHIWEGYKLDALRKGMETADAGICMSGDTMRTLIEWKLPKNKLSYVLPAHDGRKRRFQIVCILTNVYPDGCKREQMFVELVKTLDKNKWAFRIMGSGWTDILTPLVADGLQVDYFAEWNQKDYDLILDSSDYNLYFGVDEGSMGVLDSKNAGMKIIAPYIGFNKDVMDGTDYAFVEQEDLNETFRKLSVNPVEGLTWKNYVDEHIKIWKKLK